MFLLSLTIPGINYKWNHLQSMLNRYGDLLSSGRVDGLSIPETHFDGCENNLNVCFCPLEQNYLLSVELLKNGIGSSSTLNPHDHTGKIDLLPRTRVIIGEDTAEITNPQFEDIAILHLRMLLTILRQTEKDSFKKMLDALSNFP